MEVQIIFALAGLVCAAIFAVPVVRLFEHRPIYVFGILFSVYLIECLPFMEGVLSLSAGGISIYPMDLVAGLLLGLSTPFILKRILYGLRKNDLLIAILLVFVACLFLNYILGAKSYGISTATNEFRSYLYIIAVSVYASTLRMDEALWNSIVRLWYWLAFVLLLIAIVGLSDGNLSRADRPLGAEETLFLLYAGLFSLFAYAKGTLRLKYYSILLVFMPMIVLLQHRSVWVVALIAGVLVFVYLPKIRGVLVKWGFIGTIVFGSIGGVLFGPKLVEALRVSYEEAVTTRTNKNTSTFVWRLKGWQELLTGTQMDSIKEKALGNAFGAGWERTMVTSDGVVVPVTVSPHSYYVQSFLRSGAIGMTAFLLLNFLLIRELFRLAKVDGSVRGVLRCLAILLIATLVFYLVYGAHYTHGLLYGAGIAWCRTQRLKLTRINQV